MIKDPAERPTASELLCHPFVADFDYEDYKQKYIDFKYECLKSLGKITEDYEESKFEGFTSTKRMRSDTIKSTSSKK